VKSNHPTLPAVLLANTQQAAKIVDIAASTLERDRAEGNLGIPYIRVGRNVRYLLSDLQQWLEDHRTSPEKSVIQTNPSVSKKNFPDPNSGSPQ